MFLVKGVWTFYAGCGTVTVTNPMYITTLGTEVLSSDFFIVVQQSLYYFPPSSAHSESSTAQLFGRGK